MSSIAEYSATVRNMYFPMFTLYFGGKAEERQGLLT